MVKKALGRGLQALLQEGDESFDAKLNTVSDNSSLNTETGELLVPLDCIIPNPSQPRSDFNEDSLAELADSIREHGIIEPPIVEHLGDGKYQLIAGERRYRAAGMVGLHSIPVLVRSYSQERKFEIALIENIQREDLNPIEEAQAYYKIMEIGNLNQDETARRVGKNRSTVANALRLLKLPDEMRSALVSGVISAGHARALLSIISESFQKELFDKIIEKGLSVRETEHCASVVQSKHKKITEKKAPETSITRDADIVAFEQSLIEQLGTKVRVSGTLERGSITIDYFSRDDLDRLYELLH